MTRNLTYAPFSDLQPADGSTFTDPFPQFTGSGTPGDTLSVTRVQGSTQNTLIVLQIGSTGSFPGLLALADGSAQYVFVETSPAGDTEAQVTRTFTLQSTTCSICPPPPPGGNATPELDSLMLFGSGFAGLAGYAALRLRGRGRKRGATAPNDPS